MSTLRVNTIQDTAGSGSPAINGLARAWVNFNGTGTVAIRAASNVSSITDYGASYYGISFTTAMPDTNYTISVFGSNVNNDDGTNYSGFSTTTGNMGTSSFAIRGLNIFSGGANLNGDCTIVQAVVFR